jgi:hypothetical protein
MKNIFYVLIFGFIAIGCRPIPLYHAQPDGPPEYRLGWEDGCDTAVSSHDGLLLKILYGFRKRPEFGNSELYKTAWNEGYGYCNNWAGKEEGWDIGVSY